MEDIRLWALVTCLLITPTSLLAIRIAIRSIKNHGTRLYAFGETEDQIRHKGTLETIARNTSKVIVRQLELDKNILELKAEIKSLKEEVNKIRIELKKEQR